MNNDTPKTPKRVEVNQFHPLVAQWLTDNGYTYQHEYKMPDYGQVDFYATHEDGHKVLVECKLDRGISKGILQLVAYLVQTNDTSGMIAAIADAITNDDIRLANKHNIKIIPIEFSYTPSSDYIIRYDYNPFLTKIEMHSDVYAQVYLPQITMRQLAGDNLEKLEELIFSEIRKLANQGLPKDAIFAEIKNSIESSNAYPIRDVLINILERFCK